MKFDVRMLFDCLFLTILLYGTPLGISKKILDFFFLGLSHIKRKSNVILIDENEVILQILLNILRIQEKEILSFKNMEVPYFLNFQIFI